MNQKPLAGVRVIDVADAQAVFGTRILADLGAEVIRVEPPEGDSLRKLAPFLDGQAAVEHSFSHLYGNTNKQSVVIDRSTSEGAAIFMRLIATADVVVETERLDHAAFRTVKPDIVHATITPFGLEGPRSNEAGNDLIAVACGGLATFCGHKDDPPNQPGAHQAYTLGGLATATSIIFAVFRNMNSNTTSGHSERGPVHLDISLQACVAATTLQSANPNYYAWRGETISRPNFASAVKCGDDRWMTGVGVRPGSLQEFLEWARGEGLDPPAAPEGLLPLELAGFYAPVTKALITRMARDAALAKTQALGMLGTPIHRLEEMEDCPQLKFTDQFVQVTHQPLGRKLSLPRSPVDALGDIELRRAPTLGEHTGILSSLPAAGELPPAEPMDLATALKGVRVVDFCWVLAGPLGTRLLANFGAEVIRVEAGPRSIADKGPNGATAAELGSFHNMVNTHKRSITIDPRDPQGRKLLLELIDSADVVTENYRAGSFAKMGFDYETLKARNPGVVLAHLPGLGSSGPWRDRATYGPHVAAAAGLSFLGGFAHRRPLGIGTAYPDFTSPYVMASVITAALLARRQSATGAELDVSQLSATISFIGEQWMQYKAHGVPPAPNANRDPNYTPHGVYASAGEDQWIAIAVQGEEQWQRFCIASGSAELATDPRFRSHALRKQNEDALDAAVSDAVEPWDKWVLARLLQESGIAAGPVETVGDMIELDPQLGSRFYQSVWREIDPGTEILIPSDAIQQAGRRPELTPAPAPGDDNAYVICEVLGYSKSDLQRWQADGVLKDYSKLA